MKIKERTTSSLRGGFVELVRDAMAEPVVGYNELEGFTLRISTNKDSDIVVLVMLENKIAGFLLLVPQPFIVDLSKPVLIHVTHSYLEKRYRGKGLGLKLYEWAADRWLITPSDKHTSDANNLWRKLLAKRKTLRIKHKTRVICDTVVRDLTKREFSDNSKYRIVLGSDLNDGE